MVATVTACSGIQMFTTTTEPEEVEALQAGTPLQDPVVNTVEGMVARVALAPVLTMEGEVMITQAQEAAEGEMVAEALITVDQAVNP